MILTLITVIATAIPLAAQDSATASDTAAVPLAAYNGLRTPVSPAFALLGVAPTMVERPNTPADLAFSVLNRSAAFTSLPRDLALEVSPYWLIKHPKLSWESDATRGVGTSLARTMTVSFGTAELGTSTRSVLGLALGVRAAPFSGRLSANVVNRLKRLEERLSDENAVLRGLTRNVETQLEKVLDAELKAATTQAQKDAANARFSAGVEAATVQAMQSEAYRAAKDSTDELFGDLALTREGFVLEMAGGAVMQAPGGAADSAKLARYGAWVTAGYTGSTLSFVLVNRFLASTVDSAFDAVDVGMRLLYTSGRYAISAEGSLRTFTETGAPPNEYRVAALVDFELQEGLWMSGTFGRDYRAGDTGSLIAQIGFSINLAGERVKIPIPGAR